MNEKVTACPACGAHLQTPAEFATHFCPTGDSQGEDLLARIQSRQALEERQKIQPTYERLQKDVASACQQLNDFWDGEVEVLVALVPRGTNQAHWCTTIPDADRFTRILSEILRKGVRSVPRSMKPGLT